MESGQACCARSASISQHQTASSDIITILELSSAVVSSLRGAVVAPSQYPLLSTTEAAPPIMPASVSSPSPELPAEATPDDRDSHVARDRPFPRRLRTPAKLVRLGVRNRRHEYLVKTPSYFDNLDHELADPVLYERLVKRFQTPAEREADGKAKGYGRTLEADLIRGETKLANLHQSAEQPNGPSSSSLDADNSKAVGDGGVGTNAWDAEAENKEHGMQLWHAYLEARFVEGMDEDFDYGQVDDNDQYDTMAIQDAEDAWFDNEEPSWADCASQSPVRRGETGIQDF
ncbi:hypothetical protein TgHK011_004765 [Trichoderma gracile]|nr:hypothetical protein TgHK011_004765 [Trichoderma gracile]